MPTPITPKALEPGATIAFISPSARLNHVMPATMARATALFTDRGYQVRTFYNKDTGIQSSISNRLSEIREAFFDPTVSAIICTIGGPSLNELMPALIADKELQDHIRKNPKIVVGYSDISFFHWFLYGTTGLRTFYGPGPIPELGEPSSVDDETSPLAFCVKHLFKAIANPAPIGDIGRSPTYVPKVPPMFKNPESLEAGSLAATAGWKWLRPGKAQGRLFGGCLTVVVRIHGIKALVPDWRGRIVFLETALSDDLLGGNPIGRVQAAIADLIAYGVFDEAAGLVVGRPFGYDTEKDREAYTDVIKGLLCEGPLASKNPFPILFNVDIGHASPIVTLPYDALAELDSENDRFAVIEPAVV